MDELAKLGPVFPGGPIGVLLIHGLTGTPAELSAIAKDLNRYGFTVLCPLLAGHCRSEAELLKTGWRDWYASVETAWQAFSRQSEAVFVGGISAGAVLSLYLAQRHPGQVRGLGLYSTTLRWDGWSIPKFSFLLPLVLRLPVIGKRYRFEENYPYGLKNEKLRERVHSQMMRGDPSSAGFSGTPGRSLLELWRLVNLMKAGLAGQQPPALLVHARDDDIASIRNALYIKEHIGGPSRLVALESSYHMITIDQERKKVGFESARWFFEQLTDAEKKKLAASAKNPELIAALSEAGDFREKPRSELLKGLSKRKHWLRGGRGPAAGCLSS
ncbi:MAG: alpha/beta fold hydrolase [Deltaproteobacteria bacterium]|jgi:carboxylesterase|nr:alpha/beta fold hydrolase [Deltaproteobacteria bacterium]